MSCGNVEQILHLSAFALALPVAYFGLDKIHRKETEMREVVERIERIANDVMTRWEPFSDGEPKIIFNTFEVFVLAKLARRRRPRKCYLNKLAALAWTSWHCPMFQLFLHKVDFYTVSLFLLISAALFFFLSGADIFEVCITNLQMKIIFSYMILSCLLIFFAVMSASSIFRLVPKLEKLQLALYERWTKAESQRLNQSLDDLEKLSSEGRQLH